MPLLIYTPSPTNRISYIFNFIFQEILPCQINFTSDQDFFIAHTGAKISYANKPLANEPFFKSAKFLLNNGLEKIDLQTVVYKNYPVCFPVDDSAMPFDVFAAAFFLISRYEEYQPAATDQHGRFKAEDSFAFKAGFLRSPVIDQWAYKILEIVQLVYPEFSVPVRNYKYIPTIDIDRAYAWKFSDMASTGARMAKALMLANTKKVLSVIKVFLNKEKDPFDTYALMKEIHKKNNPIFFFLMGDCSRYDNSISCNIPQFRQLIKEISGYAEVGVHPSYQSNIEPEKILAEKARLEEIVNKKVEKSRQHFLKMEKPLTYQRLLKAGIKEDHSMGFASQAGFRAGTCTPYNWYDLSQEKETNLKVYPFAAMEVTLKKYMRLKPSDALLALKNLCDGTKAVNGTFITLWHNESLTDLDEWKGWLQVYQEIVNYASE